MRPKACDVHFKPEGVIVLAVRYPLEGKSERCHLEPLIMLEPGITALELGRAIRQALDYTERGPGDHGADLNAALRRFGIKGWAGLLRSSRSFHIEDDETRVKIEARPIDGLFNLIELDIHNGTCGRGSEEIGQRLLEMLSSCPLSAPLTPPRLSSSYCPPRSNSVVEDRSTPQSFGYKLRWLVIDTTDAIAVASALGLRDLRPANWSIDPYAHEGVFVSPSVLGWTFVTPVNMQSNLLDYIAATRLSIKLCDELVGSSTRPVIHSFQINHASVRGVSESEKPLGDGVQRRFGLLKSFLSTSNLPF